ncbi:MAG: CPBP family intramembrane metalloprotease [Planctomycetaceae bacterium]|nr:CPBP family intramembrane metalloprotease [Planctomycetaceae bacterium]
MPDTPNRLRALLVLLLIVPAPTIGVIAGLIVNDGPMGRIIWGVSKAWLFGLPILWHVYVDRERPTWPQFRRDGLAVGASLGIAISIMIIGAYLLIGQNWIDQAVVSKKAEDLGLNRVVLYVAGCVYWITINSLLEEYVYRWFIFRQCEVLLRHGGAAMLVSAACFTLHHVFALNAWFDWKITLAGSIGVFIGGAVWSWCYQRYRSIWSPYISHAIVDIAVFAIGAWMFFG